MDCASSDVLASKRMPTSFTERTDWLRVHEAARTRLWSLEDARTDPLIQRNGDDRSIDNARAAPTNLPVTSYQPPHVNFADAMEGAHIPITNNQ